MPEVVEVRGLAELERALQTLPEKLERNVMRGALRAGGKVFLLEARRRVPVRTGELRKSLRISVRKVRGMLTAFIKAGNKKAWYPHLVEFGTAAHLIKPRNRKSLLLGIFLREIVEHPGAQMHPFMRPAFDNGVQGAIAAFAAYVHKRLTKQGIEIPSEG